VAKLIAHRGASFEEPENTLASIAKALEIGVDFIEFDVHLSKDGVPVIIHDHTLCRTSPVKGRHVRLSALEELKGIDVGSWFHGEETEEEVPTLEEVLKLNLQDVGLMVELKDDIGNDLSHAVGKLLETYPHHLIVLGSFHSETLRYYQKCHPALSLLGIASTMEELEAHQRLNLHHFALDYTLFLKKKRESPQFLSEHRVWTFTVDEPEIAKELIELGVEGIITNHPRLIKQFIY
jgi:glycerophosphoryl diester phosphodiesterase